jgi:hypothetical protein
MNKTELAFSRLILKSEDSNWHPIRKADNQTLDPPIGLKQFEHEKKAGCRAIVACHFQVFNLIGKSFKKLLLFQKTVFIFIPASELRLLKYCKPNLSNFRFLIPISN